MELQWAPLPRKVLKSNKVKNMGYMPALVGDNVLVRTNIKVPFVNTRIATLVHTFLLYMYKRERENLIKSVEGNKVVYYFLLKGKFAR